MLQSKVPRADAVDLAVREGTRWYFAIEIREYT